MARRRRRAVAEEASHGLQSLTQQIQATPHRRLACGDVISAVSDALYEVVRASFRQKPVARVQEMRLHGWVLGELGVGADKHSVSRSRSHTARSKLRTSLPYYLWRRGLDTRMMCCSVWWSPKRRLFSAAKNCSPQE